MFNDHAAHTTRTVGAGQREFATTGAASTTDAAPTLHPSTFILHPSTFILPSHSFLAKRRRARFPAALMSFNAGFNAVLALEDGSVFRGRAFGATATVAGEAVFNTSMTGYQEILTDPSYFGQIVTMTFPEIGNYGVNPDDVESGSVKCAGLVVRRLSPIVSNWRAAQPLGDYLRDNGVPGIEEVDTRAITKKLRVAGVMKACLSTENIASDDAVRIAREWRGTVGADFVGDVTCAAAGDYAGAPPPFTVPGTSLLKDRLPDPARPRYRVAAYDFGAKSSIFKRLANAGFDVRVFPAKTPAAEVLAWAPDGVFLSNGPGDPAALAYAHDAARALIAAGLPVFGICLGHQIIAHAIGAETYKLKFGHRGGNQPVKNVENGIVSITAQNHGFAASRESVERAGAVVTEINLNDNTVAGLRLRDKPVFSVQYHPEAGPGPNDAAPLFARFYQLVAEHKAATGAAKSA
ncbi:MAG: glutamine-hydrolyzing carbamoyl-phosphate synthase small subunit [Puniceicoccales bacterium]|nr:glutamine-hydrolyzing carbamoyl-phosphate synthase small subunit [Puniceicoccales bacterium]